jgi:glutamate carboxypeptidase
MRAAHARLIGTGALLLSFGGAAPLSGQGLDARERRMAEWIERHTEPAIALLARTVEISSGTYDPEGVRAVADVLAPELQALGFQVRWIPQHEVERGGHLVAERLGRRGSRVLLIGHLDTVFERDDEFRGFVRDDTIARGPGVNDMKGGNIVMLLALQALHAAGALEDRTVRVIFTGDEEAPGTPLAISRRDLRELAQASDAALEFETLARAEEHDYATVARRGSSTFVLRTTGRTAHSSGIFSPATGAGAAFEAARILNAFYVELREEPHVNFNAGVIVGGTEVGYDAGSGRGTAFGKTNVVPAEVIVHGGIRTLTDEQLERTRERMRAIVARSLPRTSAELSFFDMYPGMPPTEGNRRLLTLYDRASRDLGLGPVLELDPGRRGASDASFAAPYTAVLSGLGVAGGGAHSPEEWVDLRSIPRQAKRAAVLIYRLTR